MSHRTASRLAWSLWALCAGLTLAASVLAMLSPSSDASGIRLSWGYAAVLALGFLAFPTVGALVASRFPSNPIGWLFCAEGLAFALASFAAEYATRTLLSAPGSLPGVSAVAWLSTWIQGPILFGALVFLLLLFPDGRLPSRRWRRVGWLAGGVIAVLALASALAPGPLEDFPKVENPVGIEALGGDVGDALQVLAFATLLGIVLASAISLIRRFRGAVGDERQQLKWFGSAAALLAIVLALGPVLWSISSDAAETAWFVLFLVALGAVPVATGIAILRYRLYDIDLIIRRTLVYSVLTAGLAGTYFGVVLALQQVFSPLTGSSDLAIAGSTLAVAALFRPVRRRILELVDQSFYRRRVDAQRTLEAFSARLRQEIDLEALTAELRGVVEETMQPRHVSLWLRTPEAGR